MPERAAPPPAAARPPLLRAGLLGPTRLWRDAAAVDLGSPQQQVVFTVLALHVAKPLGRDQLMSAVWGSEPPVRATNLLQRRVSGLRRALEPDREAHGLSTLLNWTDTGYVLSLPAGSTDLEEFDKQVQGARADRTRGALAEAASGLHAALQLWRGRPWHGLYSPFLDLERDRLQERRLDVVEDRIELDLALGRHADVVAELRQLVAEEPLRERLHELLMLALHRAGRQADALAVFQQARVLLDAELGLEPGASLQLLQQQVLTADPALDLPADGPGRVTPVRLAAPAPSTAADWLVVPAQLPHVLEEFVGREAELERLDALMAQGAAPGAVIALTGTAGVGKTALAVHWAHQLRERFADGLLYVDLRGFDPTGSALEPAEAIRGFLDAFALPPQRLPVSLDGQVALYRSLLADRRMLILLDNARDSDQVRQLLPGSEGSLVVVTSRNQLAGLVAVHGAHPVVVDLLDGPASRELLARRIGRQRLTDEPAEVAQIVEVCAGLPLALSIVAARAVTRPTFPLAVLSEGLADAQARLDAFYEGELSTDVRAVFSWSYTRLGDPAAGLFRLLALHPGPDVALPALASLAGAPLGAAGAALSELARMHLVTERVPGRFAFHDLLRAYAAELSASEDPVDQRLAAWERLLEHYLAAALHASALLNPHSGEAPGHPQAVAPQTGRPRDQREALRWFATEHAVLLGVIRTSRALGYDAQVCTLASTLSPFFEYQGHWHDWAETQQTALAAALRTGNVAAEALAHRVLGRAHIRLGSREASQHDLQDALRLYAALGDPAGQAQTHRDLSWVLELQGRHEEALREATSALALFRLAGQQAGQARALNAIGWFQCHLGDEQEALVSCTQALHLQQVIDDRYGQAETLDSLGLIHQRLGDVPASVVAYERALALYRAFDDRYNEADTLDHLGAAQVAAGDHDSGRRAWRRALLVLDQLGHPDADDLRQRMAALG